ncbi:MAG: hypothetical protein IPK13_23900 [Deltaproteobacteria bacterium]|nr:hypothetical protein [Deltaproteobacteria bacterium]
MTSMSAITHAVAVVCTTAALFASNTAPASAKEPTAPPTRSGVEISTHIEATTPGDTALLVGKPFVLAIEVTHEPGFIALLPTSLDLGPSIGERTSARKHSRRSAEDARETDAYRLELIAFESGTMTIPAIPFAVGSTTAATSPLEVEVSTNFRPDEMPVATSTRPEAMAELEKMAAPNPAPASVRVSDFTLLYALLGLLTLVAIFLMLRRWVRLRHRQDKNPRPEDAPPPPPAHDEALRRLKALADLQAEIDDKAFFVEISRIVRTYLGRRYRFDSLELTLDELLEILAQAPRPNLDMKRLKNLLSDADLVKFAKYIPERDERTSALNAAFGLVEATKQTGEQAP